MNRVAPSNGTLMRPSSASMPLVNFIFLFARLVHGDGRALQEQPGDPLLLRRRGRRCVPRRRQVGRQSTDRPLIVGREPAGGRSLPHLSAIVRSEPRRERRRKSRPVQGVLLELVCEVVCSSFGINRAERSHRGNRHPARAALVQLARRRTTATNAELTAVLGVLRAESVPNMTRRSGAW